MAQWSAWELRGRRVAKPRVNFNGIWKNELGSGMEIRVRRGTVSGHYQTAVGSPKPGQRFKLAGWANGDLISFVVDWGKHGSQTAWVGQHTVDDDSEARIKTMWHLVKNIREQDEPDHLWSAFLSGCDTFALLSRSKPARQGAGKRVSKRR